MSLPGGDYPRTDCGCGYEIIFTPEGWQHDAAPYLWGDDHDPDPGPAEIAFAEQWLEKWEEMNRD